MIKKRKKEILNCRKNPKYKETEQCQFRPVVSKVSSFVVNSVSLNYLKELHESISRIPIPQFMGRIVNKKNLNR